MIPTDYEYYDLHEEVIDRLFTDLFEDDEEDEDWEPIYDEFGYDPYQGCYDWDC